MKLACMLLASALVSTMVFASDLVSAKVVAIKKYERGRVVDWVGRVPIYDDRPVFDITIQVGQDREIVRYESNTGYYPNAWKVGQQIQVKKGRGEYVLMRGDEEVRARIVSDHDCVLNPDRSASVPILPCP